MIIDFIIEDLMLNSYLQKNFHTLVKAFEYSRCFTALYFYMLTFYESFLANHHNRVGEISAFAEISTSHTTVRTVPYTAVQST